MPVMTTETASRQPKGIPAGGQFAPGLHAEPVVDLTEAPAGSTQERFAALMTEGLAADLNSRLAGKIQGKDWYSGARKDQVFEAEVEDDGLSIYTRNPASDEGVSYAVTMTDGTARIHLHDDHSPDVNPRDLHPERWATPDDAAREITHVILDMEGADSRATAGQQGTQDGFASDADYRRWREG